MYRLPPLRQLQAFESAARLLSFRKAAEELSVTPTAVSHQIRLLERYCGQPLFQRQPRPLQLTTAGAQLLPVVRDAFLSISDELARVTPESPIGHIRVTTTSAFAARWLQHSPAGPAAISNSPAAARVSLCRLVTVHGSSNWALMT